MSPSATSDGLGRLRRLTPQGMVRANDYLNTCRLTDDPPACPRTWLFDPRWSAQFSGGTVIIPTTDAVTFKTRQSAGQYLSAMLSGVQHQALHSTSMWSWLSMFLLADLVPSASDLPAKHNLSILLAYDGEGSPSWAKEPRGWARHWLWTSWRLHEQHGLHSGISALLERGVRHWDAFEYRMFGSQKWFSSSGVMAAAERLYLYNGGGIVRGTDSKFASGGIRHFLRILPQLELIYDLYDMSGDAVLHILPKPFQEWLEKRGA